MTWNHNSVQWGLFGILLLVILIPGAEATTAKGCVGIIHQGTAGAQRQYTVSTDVTQLPGDVCASTDYLIDAGSCDTWFMMTANMGGAPPASPSRIELWIHPDTFNNDHGNTGKNAWSPGTGPVVVLRTWASQAAFDGDTISICGTENYAAGGNVHHGTFRVTLRVCSTTGADCDTGISTYDINSDDGSGGGQPGAGNTIAARNQGAFVSRVVVTSFEDSRTGTGGADESTWIGGDVPTLYLTDTSAPSGGVFGGAAYTFSTVGEGGSVIASAVDTTVVNDASVNLARIIYTDGYTNDTTPTKRVRSTGLSDLLSEPETRFSNSVPAGVTFTSDTQLDAAFGDVDKGLRINCASVETVHNRGETAQCTSATVETARDLLSNGDFLRVYRRPGSSESYGSVTSVPSCDTTSGTSGVWTCDAVIKTTATVTTGTDYAVDMTRYSAAGRTVEWARGTIAHRFDVSSTGEYSVPGSLICGTGPSTTRPVNNRGDGPVTSFRACNARGEELLVDLDVFIVTQDTGATEDAQTLAQASGVYAHTYTISPTDSATFDVTGQSKRLVATWDGNTISLDDVFTVSRLLDVASIGTWVNSCSGAQRTMFVIGADLVCLNEGPVTKVYGDAHVTSKTFARTYVEGITGSTLSPDQETGVTSDSSSDHLLTPQPPASTQWLFTVTVTDALGNSGILTKEVTFISPLTAQFEILGIGNFTTNASGVYSIIIRTLRTNVTTANLDAHEPDDPPFFVVRARDAGAMIIAVPLTESESTLNDATIFWVNWTLPGAFVDSETTLSVSANFSGVAVTRSWPILVSNQTIEFAETMTLITDVDAFVPFILFIAFMLVTLKMGWIFPAVTGLIGAAAYIGDPPFLPLSGIMMILLSGLVAQMGVNMIHGNRTRENNT